MSHIWCSNITTIFIYTSRKKWILWQYHPWARPIDMQSKLSRSLNKRCENLGLGIPRSKNQEREVPTYRTKDRARMDNLSKTSLSRKQRRTMGRQRKTLGSGVSSIRALGITPLNVSKSSHWWSRWKPMNQMWVPTLRQNQKKGDRSLTW